MPAVTRRLRTIVVLAAALTAGLSAHMGGLQTPIEQPKGTGLLMGQVVDASTAKPVAGVLVTISGGTQSTIVLPTGEVVVNNAPPGSTGAGVPGAPRQVLTDAGGRFIFRELTHGRYSIRTTAPGYLAGGFGQNRPSGGPQSIELVTDDEKRGDLVIRLWKTAGITGTVVDETGEPVVGFSIRVIKRTMQGGKPRLSQNNSAATDDRGVYRVSSLAPGDYLVAVMSTQTTMPSATADAYMQVMMSGVSMTTSDLYRELNSSGAPSPSMGGYRVGDLIMSSGASGRGGGGSGAPPAPADDGRVFIYPTQYYPAAAVSSQATVITLASGEERAGINLQLKLSPTVRVSGTVAGPDGPARNLGVKLFPLGADEFTSESGIETASTATDAMGAFTFLGVTPGQYTLKSLRVPRPITSSSPSNMTTIEVNGPNGMIMGVSSSNGSSSAPQPALPTEPTLSATMSVSVGESDLAGLSVALRPGARLSGRLAFEGTAAPQAADQLQRASISINPISGSAPMQIALASKRIETDGRFSSVGYPPGRYLVSAFFPSTPGGPSWTLKSAMAGGHDVADEGLEIGAEDVAGIVITFTDKTTDLSGTVLDAKGQPDKTATVVIMPADSQAWKQGVMNARRLRSVRTSTKGAYSAAGLPAGDYLVAALSDETLGEWQDPKMLEKIAAIGTHVTIGDGEKKTQELTTRIIR